MSTLVGAEVVGWISLVDSERGGAGAVSNMLTPVKVVVTSRTCRCRRGWWVFVDASKGGGRATLIPMEEGGGAAILKGAHQCSSKAAVVGLGIEQMNREQRTADESYQLIS